MPEPDNSQLADPAAEILVHVEPSFVQLADHPAIDEPLAPPAELD